MQVTDEMVERAKASLSHIRYGLSDAELRRALTAALVDVPAVESEPVGYLFELFYPGSDRWSGQMFSDHDPAANLPAEHVRNVRPLYTLSPLSRGGEDSAEVERLRCLLSRAEEYVIDGVTNAKAEAEMNAPYPARAPRYDAALAEVRQLYADIQTALAITTRNGVNDAP